MKNIISILALVALLMISCKKEFIEVIPVSIITADLVFKTDKDFSDALIGCYKELKDVYSEFWQFSDLIADDTEHLNPNSFNLIAIDAFAFNPDDGFLIAAWRNNYQAIERTNTVLYKAEKADVSIVTNKEIFIAEAKFIRALAYFNLVRIFGDVPMITAPITILEALKMPREKVDIIYNEVIIPDLLEVETILPTNYSAANVGRATKGAAKSLLGKVYLTRKDFVNAESKLMEVTTMGYALLDNFNDLFAYKNEHHSEYIFDIEYISGNVGLGSPFMGIFFMAAQEVGLPLDEALQQVYNVDNYPHSGAGTPSAELEDLFDPNDLRKDITVASGIFNLQGIWIPVEIGAKVPRFTKKYYEVLSKVSDDSGVNWKVIRYADVLLMLAEAMNENNKTAAALPYLNQVRTRAGLSGYSGLTQSDARDKIYLERRFELYLEGHRWFDLIRTGRALDVMAPHGMKDYMILFPIPQTQIDVINDPEILPQNPGY